MTEEERQKKFFDSLCRVAKEIIKRHSTDYKGYDKDFAEELKKKYYRKDQIYYWFSMITLVIIFLFITFISSNSFNWATKIVMFMKTYFLDWFIDICIGVFKTLSALLQLFIPIYFVELLRMWNRKKSCYKYYSGNINVLMKSLKIYNTSRKENINGIKIETLSLNENQKSLLFYDFSDRYSTFTYLYENGIIAFDKQIRNAFVLTRVRYEIQQEKTQFIEANIKGILENANEEIKYINIKQLEKLYMNNIREIQNEVNIMIKN